MAALAQLCAEADRLNREAESRADRLADIPIGVNCKPQVDKILRYDDLYRKTKERIKYLQEHQALPVEEAQRVHHQRYEVPKGGVELAISVRNLAKNVSTWKGRLDNPKFPDAPAKYAMYVKLYQEARASLNRERASINQSHNAATDEN